MTTLKFEAWTQPGVGDFEKIIDVPVLPGSSGLVEDSSWRDLNFNVPSDWPYFDQVIADTKGSLIRCFYEGTVIDEGYADRILAPVERPGTRTLNGPQIQGAVEFCGIYPYNYPNHTGDWLDWVWGGDEVLKSTDGSGSGNETQKVSISLSNPKHTHLVSSIDSTQTTFDVDTASIFDNPGYCVIDSERMEITGISGNTLTVVRGVDGTTAASHSAGTNNIHRSAGGSFTLTFDGQTTAAIDFGPGGTSPDHSDGADVESDLEALSNITDVVVLRTESKLSTSSPDHSGIQSSDKVWDTTIYEVEFINPTGDVTQMVPNGSNLVGATVQVFTEAQGGQEIEDWTVAQTIEGDEIGTYVEPKIRPADVSGGEPANSIAVFARGQYAGGQQIIDVPSGGIAQISVEINPYVTSNFVIEIRDGDTYEHLARTPDTQCVASSFTTLSITDFQIPATTTKIIFRVLLVFEQNDAYDSFHFRNPSFRLGLVEATPGKIVRLLVEAAQARGTLTWVDISSFTDTLDSDGVAWPSTLSFTAFADSNLGHVLADLHRMGDSANAGYRWTITPKSTDTILAGNPTHNLNMYVPGGGGQNLTTSPGAPTLTTGTIVDGNLAHRIPAFTTLLAHGAEGLYYEETDATLEANFDRRERITDAEHLASTASLTELAQALHADQDLNLRALDAQVRGDANKVPGVDYGPRDTIWWQFPSIQDRIARPVKRFTWTHGQTEPSFQVQGSRILSPDAGLAEAVSVLLREFKPRPKRTVLSRRAARGAATTDIVTGALLHLTRASTQTIPVGGDIIAFTAQYLEAVAFSTPSFPAIAVTIPKDGYYDIQVSAGWASFTGGGSVSIIRERDGIETTVWPPTVDAGDWTSTYGRVFEGVAPAIACKQGDTIRAEIDHNDASSQDLADASLSVYLVDHLIEVEAGNYQEAVLADGPLAYWRFDESSGTTASDIAGHPSGPFHMTYNGPTLGAEPVMRDNTGNPSVDLDGNDEITGADWSEFDFAGNAPFSLEAWINTDTVAVGQGIIIQKQTGNSGPGWELIRNGDFVGGNRITSGGTQQGVNSPAGSITVGTDHHVVMTYDGSTLRLYLDGVDVGSNETNVSMGTTTVAVTAGWDPPTPGAEFDGQIDELAVYDRALSPAEVQEHYAIGTRG